MLIVGLLLWKNQRTGRQMPRLCQGREGSGCIAVMTENWVRLKKVSPGNFLPEGKKNVSADKNDSEKPEIMASPLHNFPSLSPPPPGNYLN